MEPNRTSGRAQAASPAGRLGLRLVKGLSQGGAETPAPLLARYWVVDCFPVFGGVAVEGFSFVSEEPVRLPIDLQ